MGGGSGVSEPRIGAACPQRMGDYVMRKWVLVFVALLAASVSQAEDDEIKWTWDYESPYFATDATIIWTQPECPDDFGPITLWVPPEWGHDTFECDCCRTEPPEEE